MLSDRSIIRIPDAGLHVIRKSDRTLFKVNVDRSVKAKGKDLLILDKNRINRTCD